MKYAIIYGGLAGAAIILTTLAGIQVVGHSELFGYLIMLVGLTLVFVGVKRYRDIECGGVIRFMPALGMGLAIAVVAGLAYVAVWEAYLAMTDYRFMDEYVASVLKARQAEGASAAALAKEAANLERLRVSYLNPLFRLPMTFLEIFPVGLAVALFSAALLRNPKVLPATR